MPCAPFYWPDHLLLLTAGLLLDSLVGEMPWLFSRFPHPVVIIGRLVTAFDLALNHRQQGSYTVSLQWRGIFTVIAIIGAVAALGMGGHWLARTLPCAWVLEVFCIGVLIAQHSLYQHVADVAYVLENCGLEKSRLSVSKICGRNTKNLNKNEIIRAAIESCAENFNDGVIAPAFWYGLCGLPCLFVYKASNTLDSMIGHCNQRYLAFGFAAARLDDVLNLIPSRFAGLLVVGAACGIPTARPLKAFTTMVQDAHKHRSPNAGWPESAMAGALGLALAGPRCYQGYQVADAWIGANGCQEATVRDIRRALKVFTLACVLNGTIVLGVWFLLCTH